MVIEPEKRRERYLAGTEGAPPVPPRGGYHGARRGSGAEYVAPTSLPGVIEATAFDDEKQPSNALGWIALSSAILFVVILLGMLAVANTDLLYGVTMITLQLIVLGVVIGALFTRRGRKLGLIALVMTLLLNVATVGGMSALQTSASGSYQGQKSEEQKFEEAYPGVKNTSASRILSQPSLEELRAKAESAMGDVRERITAEFGYTWVQIGDEVLRPERNGYGGESMLVEYSSVGWSTVEPIHGYAHKLEVMAVVEDVLYEHGLSSMYAFNDAESYLDDTTKAKFYGTADPATQHTWEWYADDYPDPLRFYGVLNDLENDLDGTFLGERQANQQQYGEPLEGLQLFVLANNMLSDADRAEFEEKMKDYPGY